MEKGEREMLEFLAIAIIIAIIFYKAYKIIDSIDDKPKRQSQIEAITEQLEEQKKTFENTLISFFNNPHGDYETLYPMLKKSVEDMGYTIEYLNRLCKKEEKPEFIHEYSRIVNELRSLYKKVSNLHHVYMMDGANYGNIQLPYFESIRSMSRAEVEEYIQKYNNDLLTHNFSKLFTVDIEKTLRCIWFFATDKPYSSQSFKRAVSLFECITKTKHIDVTIAEIYAINTVGGEEFTQKKVKDVLKNSRELGLPTADDFTLIASSLMWMNAYKTEKTVLNHMFDLGIPMSEKLQERLHSLAHGSLESPKGYNVNSDNTTLYFDISSLTWKDAEYKSFFENMSFEEKPLTYSLAIRDEDKELFISNSTNVPGIDTLLAKIKTVLTEEYGSTVTAEKKKCIALSSIGEETVEGILVESCECKHMGIIAHVVRIGKKINIKFYTLFIPRDPQATSQKQQALSLYKKLSPSVTLWERSMKDTVLMAIQQILNTDLQTSYTNEENSSKNYGEPIF